MANLGFIGLGTMGGPMVKRLLQAGHTVTGYNRTKARGEWLVELGMRWADTRSPITYGIPRRANLMSSR